METTVLGLRHLREYVTAKISAELPDAAIAEGEVRIADIKRKLALQPCRGPGAAPKTSNRRALGM